MMSETAYLMGGPADGRLFTIPNAMDRIHVPSALPEPSPFAPSSSRLEPSIGVLVYRLALDEDGQPWRGIDDGYLYYDYVAPPLRFNGVG